MDITSVEYSFAKITEDQFATFEENFNPSDEIEIGNEISFSFDFQNRTLVCSETINLQQNSRPLAKMRLSCYFVLSPKSFEDLLQDDKIELPKGILCQFASLNYGTLRGALFERTKDTALKDVILPPLFLDTIIKENHIFKKKD